jgi:hypothetical protein
MGYYKLRCGCVIKVSVPRPEEKVDAKWEWSNITTCNNHISSQRFFPPPKSTKFHPTSYGAIQLSKFEASIEKLQANQ